jgi:hypothetical protein
LGLKVSKSANMTLNIYVAKFEYKYSKNAEFYADFKTEEKTTKKLLIKKLQAKEVSKFGVCTLLYCSARTRARIGLLGKSPQQSSIRSPSRASSRTRLLHSPHTNAGMKQYECGRTQPLFRACHDHGLTSGQNLKG